SVSVPGRGAQEVREPLFAPERREESENVETVEKIEEPEVPMVFDVARREQKTPEKKKSGSLFAKVFGSGKA
ncbi:MAG: hypothetical protein KAS74_05740, partial [Methanosarcinales archaeon]|nr:hypothetical protein [Methanosarcinales archaeon]